MSKQTASDEAGSSQPREGSEFAVEEYRSFWSHYGRTLDERKNLLDWYFKVITIPSAALAIASVVLSKSQTEFVVFSQSVLGPLLVVVWCAGASLFVAYHREGVNASKCINCINGLRKLLTQSDEAHAAAVKSIDARFPEPQRSLLSVKFWRSVVLATLNSAAAAAGIVLWTATSNQVWLFLAFVASMIVHLGVFLLLQLIAYVEIDGKVL